MTTDAELLDRYAKTCSESAFTELVQRHIGLVYSSAMRRTSGNHHLAEDITQKVFTCLARKSIALKNHPSLPGWLYRTTRYVAIDALRQEQTRRKLAENLQSMSDENSSPEHHLDWANLRPVLDDALDHLKERDRELMLLRFFHGLTFAEIGERLRLSENAARMRTDRALEKLRFSLRKRGITSTATVLGTLLANQAATAAPVGLATSVAATAATVGPATGLAGLGTLVFMSKITAPALSALAAAALTALVCTSTAKDRGPEIATLRRENIRLKQAATANNASELARETANTYAAQAVAVAKAITSRQEENLTGLNPAKNASRSPEVSPRGYRDQGNHTPKGAAMTFAYACDIADPSLMAKMIYFDDSTRAEAWKMLATMPEAIRTQYPTPEAFYGLCIAAGCIEAPPPRAELAEAFGTIAETGPGRFATRRLGSDRNIHEYQQTAEGWKFIVPAGAIAGAPGALNSDLLYKLSAGRPKN